MSKIAVVYWSGTGNTEKMALAVAEGAKAKGAEAVALNASEFDVSMFPMLSGVAFGCPAMGSEQLEEDEFGPMFDKCKAHLKGIHIALFGSYGWGNGEWMEDWKKVCVSSGAILVSEPVICCGAPENDTTDACKALGAALA